MQKRSIYILVLVTLVLVGILFAKDIATQWARTDSEKATFLPSIKKQLASVAQMVITIGGGRDPSKIHLVRTADSWRVQEKGNYLADIKKVRQFLIRIAEAMRMEPKTTRSEYYEKIGVQEPNEKGGARVDLLGPGAKPIASFLIGRFVNPQNGTYVRKWGEPQSWLVSGNLTPEAQVRNWLDKEIINLSPDTIQKITIQLPKKNTLVLTKNKREDLHFKLEGVAKTVQTDQEKVDELGGALRYVQFVEVRKKADADFEAQRTTQLEYRLFDGLVLKTKLAVVDNQNLFTLEAIEDTEQEKLFATAGLSLSRNGGYSAEALQAKVQGWTYILPPYKANSMVNTLDQLVKKKK